MKRFCCPHIIVVVCVLLFLSFCATPGHATSGSHGSPRPSPSHVSFPTFPPFPTSFPYPSAFDSSAYDVVIATGTIFDSEGNRVRGATVSIVCNGHTYTKTTNALGMYIVTFGRGECHSLDLVSVSAYKGDASGSASGEVRVFRADVDVTLLNVAVPEFGQVFAITAALGGFSAFYFARRRFVA